MPPRFSIALLLIVCTCSSRLQHNLSSLYHWYQRLSEDYPHIVTLNKTIGKTYYEREIIALHFTDRNEQRSKPKIYLQCLLHSSELV